jgi:hypothetical protein
MERSGEALRGVADDGWRLRDPSDGNVSCTGRGAVIVAGAGALAGALAANVSVCWVS